MSPEPPGATPVGDLGSGPSSNFPYLTLKILKDSDAVDKAANSSHDEYTHQILDAFDAEPRISQRSLSRRLGIALGLTNLLIRRLVQKGWVRMVGIKPRRVRYLLTPTGISEKARMSQAAFQNAVNRYRVARDRIQTAFMRLSAEWPETDGSRKILFYGTGEVAEIGYICLQDTDFDLIGAIDDDERPRFFDLPVYSRESLTNGLLSSHPSTKLIVMSTGSTERIGSELKELGVPRERIVWI